MLCAPNFVPIRNESQIFTNLLTSQSCVYHIAKNYLLMIKQVTDSLTKISLVGMIRRGLEY